MNLRKIVAFSQIGLATRFPTPSVHAMLPDLDGRTHAPSVGADVEKNRALAKRLDRKACSKMDLRSDEERRGATRAEEQWLSSGLLNRCVAADRRDGCHMCRHQTATNHSRSSPSPPSHFTIAHMFCLVL